MSALLRDLRVGQWIYAESLGSKPDSGGLMGKIICGKCGYRREFSSRRVQRTRRMLDILAAHRTFTFKRRAGVPRWDSQQREQWRSRT